MPMANEQEAKTNQPNNNKPTDEDVGEEGPLYTVVKASTMKISMYLSKTKNRNAVCSSYTILGYIPEGF